jgi:succinate dehydrogenase/fumarate reductase flavoprotein subunit
MPIDMTTEKIALEGYKYDVLVIGAGGAGIDPAFA